MSNNKKTLLILSGCNGVADIIRYAKSKGIYTVATDYYKDRGEKIEADKYYNISTTNINAILDIAKKHKVNGVTTGTSESSMHTVMNVTKILGLPFYANEDTLEKINNKISFKELLRKNDLPIIPHYSKEKVVKEDLYPVIVKPADSSGAKGISICFNEKELNDSYSKALEHSRSKSVIIEKYMGNADEVFFNYNIVDGQYSLSCGFDLFRIKRNVHSVPLPVYYYFPSKHTLSYINKTHKKITKLLSSVGVNNGTISIQCFYDGDKFYVYEAGYRIGGAQSYHFTELNGGNNVLKMMVDYSITGKMITNANWHEKENPFFTKSCAQVNIPVGEGVVSETVDMEVIKSMKGVLNVTQNKYLGDVIKEDGSLGQLYARVHIYGNNDKELKENINNLYRNIYVNNTKGENMIIYQ